MRLTRLSGAELRRLSAGTLSGSRAQHTDLADLVNAIAFPWAWRGAGWHAKGHYSHNLRRNWLGFIEPKLVEAGWADPFERDGVTPFESEGALFMKHDHHGDRCVEDWRDLYNAGDTYAPTLWVWVGHGTYWCTLGDVVRTMERRGFRSSEDNSDYLLTR